MQGRNVNIIDYTDSLNCFIEQLSNWIKKIDINEFDMFINVFNLLRSIPYENAIVEKFKTESKVHLQCLREEFKKYFPELSKNEFDLIRNPFIFLTIMLPAYLQDEHIKLKNDSYAKDTFRTDKIDNFWARIFEKYPLISNLAAKSLIPFVSTYLCESGFSTLLQIKSKSRNKLISDSDLRCALSNLIPDIEGLCNKK